MKRNIMRLAAAVAAFSILTASAQQKTVFILDFKNRTKLNDASLGQGMAALFTNALKESSGFRVVERGAVLQAVMKDQTLSLSAAMNDMSKSVRIGQLVGADGLIAGSVTDASIQQAARGSAGRKSPTARVIITARLVDISTAEVVAAVQGTGESDVAAGSVLPTAFGFGEEGFSQSPFGKAALQAVGQAIASLAKQTGMNVPVSKAPAVTTELKAPAAPVTNASAPVAPPAAPDQPASAAPAAAAADGTGDLYVATDPPGANIVIDGSPVSGLTPVTLQNFKAGFHKIDVTNGERYGTITIMLKKDDLLKVNIPMLVGKGTLKLFVQPDGAEVILDGKSQGTPPLKIDGIAAGKHELQISKGGFFTDKKTVTLGIGELQTVNVTLKPVSYLSLTVKPEANVTVNGRPAQKTPQGLIIVPAGEVTVTIDKQGYDTSVSAVTVAPGETKKLEVKLVSVYSVLKVITDPPGAKVLINGQQEGVTPYENAKLEPGTYTVQLDLVDYESQQGSVTVLKNETKEIKSKLLYLYGVLKITSKPAGAKVFLNEKEAGITPFLNPRAQLGNSMLRVALPGYEEAKENIAVAREAVCEKNYELKHTKAFLDSVSAYKLHKYRKGRWTRRIVFGLLGGASAGTGIVFNSMAQKNIDKMNDIQADYDAAKINFNTYQPSWQKEKDKSGKNILIRNICYGVAGAFGAVFLISIPF